MRAEVRFEYCGHDYEVSIEADRSVSPGALLTQASVVLLALLEEPTMLSVAEEEKP